MDREMDEDPASNDRRSGHLRCLYAFLLVSPLLALAFITAPIVASNHRTRLETELKEFGRQKTLALRGLGKEVYEDFVDSRIGGCDTDQYNGTQQAQKARDQLSEIMESDPRIKAIAIFASTVPTAHPRGVVIRIGYFDCWSKPVSLFMDDEVMGWRGVWREQSVEGEMFFFRAPVAGSGSQLYATANLALSARLLERDAAAMRNGVLAIGLCLVTVAYCIALKFVSRVKPP